MKDFGVGKILLALALLGSLSLQAEEAYDVEWVKQFGTELWDEAKSITRDTNGSIFVAGSTYGRFNGTTQHGYKDAIITKLSNDGTILWNRQLGSSSRSEAEGITVDNNGDIFACGYTEGSFNGQTSKGGSDGFIVKYNTHGTLLWTKQFGTIGKDFVRSITSDKDGNIFVSGFTYGTFAGENNLGLSDGFIIKYDTNGTLLWNKQFGTTNYDSINEITSDKDGNIFVAGYTFGTFAGENKFSTGNDSFIAKYSNEGIFIWAKQFGTPSSSEAFSITSDKDGNLFVGASNGSAIVKFDNNGTLIWSQNTYIHGKIESITTDSRGNPILTGYARDYSHNVNVFIAKTNSDGTPLWTKYFGTASTDVGYSIITDDSNIFVTGYTAGTFDGEISSGTRDIFLAKLSSPNTAPVAVATATPQAVILNGTTVALYANQSYDPDADNISYKWGWIEKPLNSTATFSNENSINPTFLADVKGSYTLYLDVTDAFDVTTRTEIVVLFNNIKPVADTGAYAPIVVGNSVNLDASASSDENGDTLTYSWSLVSKPAGSTTAIYNNQNVQAHLTADVEGTYEVSLIVNDGTVDSDPVNTIIEAITVQTATTDLIEQAIRELLAMPDSSFSNKNHRKTLINKLNVVVKMLASSEYQNAISKLQNDLLPKVDNYLNSTQAYETDWIISAGDQSLIYDLITKVIGYLQSDINQ